MNPKSCQRVRLQRLPGGGRREVVSLLSPWIWSGWGLETGSQIARLPAWTSLSWSSRTTTLPLVSAPHWQIPSQPCDNYFKFSSSSENNTHSCLGCWCYLCSFGIGLWGWDYLIRRTWCQTEFQLALKDGAQFTDNIISQLKLQHTNSEMPSDFTLWFPITIWF